MNLKNFRQELARALDDNLHTKRWHNYVDYLIIGMILLSTVAIFISTFTIAPWLQTILNWIDIITLLFFTVEVTARIWVAPEINPKWSGFWGRVRYCFSFWGLIDVLATYPIYLQWLFPLPVAMLRVLRMARLARMFRIGRYSKSANLWVEAIVSKKYELVVSVQFLIIATIILSIILFYAEHEVQPDVYNNGVVSVLWAFAQYIGDPGNFADTPPVTALGKLVASIVGFLGIAVFAIPTGIFSSGFSDALESRKEQKKNEENARKIEHLFKRTADRQTKWKCAPQYQSLASIQVKSHIAEADIMSALDYSDNLRLMNLAANLPADENPQDRLVIERFIKNRDYGCCIDRGSEVTICMTSAYDEASTSQFGFYLALACGFNFISREVGDLEDKQSFYNIKDDNSDPNLPEFLKDVTALGTRPNATIVPLLITEAGNTIGRDSLIHFNCGGKKSDEQLASDTLTISNVERFRAFYTDVATHLNDDFQLPSDVQRYFGSSAKTNVMQILKNKGVKNSFTIRISYKILLGDQRRMAIAQTIAHALARHFSTTGDCEEPACLKANGYGYEGQWGTMEV